MSTPFANAAIRAGQSMLRRMADAQATLSGGQPVSVIYKAERELSNLAGLAIEADDPYIIAMAADVAAVAPKAAVSVQSAPRNIQPTAYTVRRVVPRNQLGQTLLVLERA